jgi:hypothetical protein
LIVRSEVSAQSIIIKRYNKRNEKVVERYFFIDFIRSEDGLIQEGISINYKNDYISGYDVVDLYFMK